MHVVNVCIHNLDETQEEYIFNVTNERNGVATIETNDEWRGREADPSQSDDLRQGRGGIRTNCMLQMECLVRTMMDPDKGVPIKTVKSFMSRVPSVFTGIDLIQWAFNNTEVADLSASH